MAATTSLARPSLDLYDEWAATVRDFGDERIHGSGLWWLLDEEDDGPREPSRDACEQLLAVLRAQADVSAPLEPGKVHCDFYWLTDGAAPAGMVGFIAVRHSLNDFLLEEGGHIGYAVRPGRRREGHASRALALALHRCAELGIERALVTCDLDNDPSHRTIEANGGVMEDVRKGKRRYWIELTPAASEAPSA